MLEKIRLCLQNTMLVAFSIAMLPMFLVGLFFEWVMRGAFDVYRQ